AADDVVKRALQTVRNKAASADGEYLEAQRRIDAQDKPVHQCGDVAGALQKFIFGVDVTKVLKNLHVLSAASATYCTVSDCLTELQNAGAALRGAGTYLPALSTRQAARSERGPLMRRPAGHMSDTRVAELVSDDLSSQVTGYETIARQLEICVLAA